MAAASERCDHAAGEDVPRAHRVADQPVGEGRQAKVNIFAAQVSVGAGTVDRLFHDDPAEGPDESRGAPAPGFAVVEEDQVAQFRQLDHAVGGQPRTPDRTGIEGDQQTRIGRISVTQNAPERSEHGVVNQGADMNRACNGRRRWRAAGQHSGD